MSALGLGGKVAVRTWAVEKWLSELGLRTWAAHQLGLQLACSYDCNSRLLNLKLKSV
jgi:hypothetical protein